MSASVKAITFMFDLRWYLTRAHHSGSTNAEIISFSGHAINSPSLKDYVFPDKAAARRGRAKRDGETPEK